MEWVLALKLAGASDREDSLSETLAFLGLVSETELSPLDGWPDCALCDVVCGLYSLVGEEGEKMRPVVERPFGSGAQLSVRAVLVRNAVPFHPRPHEGRRIQELPAADGPVTKRLPANEDVPDLFEHVFREHTGLRTAPAFFEVLELTDQVGPAQLPDSLLVVTAVGRMVVRGDHSLEDLAQNGFENLGTPACSQGEVDNQRRDEHPEIAAIAFALPSRLVNIEGAGFAKGLPDLLSYGFKLGTDPVYAVADRSQAKVQTEEGVQDFDDPSSADLVDRSEIGNGSMNSRTELALCDFQRKLRSRPVTTGASQLMTPVLGPYGFDIRQFKSLVAFRFRCLLRGLRVQRSATFRTGRRIMMENVVHLLNGQQLPLVSLVPFLAPWRA